MAAPDNMGPLGPSYRVLFQNADKDSNMFLKKGDSIDVSQITVGGPTYDATLSVDQGTGNVKLYSNDNQGAVRLGSETGEFFLDNLVNGDPTQIQTSVNFFIPDSGDLIVYPNGQTTAAVDISSVTTGGVKAVSIRPNPSVGAPGIPAAVMLSQSSPVPIYRAITAGGSGTGIESSWAGMMNILNVSGTGVLTLNFASIANQVAGATYQFIYQAASTNSSILLQGPSGAIGTVTKTATNQVFTVYYDGAAYYPIVPVTSF